MTHEKLEAFGFWQPRYTNFVVNRGFLKDGRPDSAAANWKAGLKIYPLARAGNPPKMEFINVSGKVMNTIHSNDFHFFKEAFEGFNLGTSLWV